MRFFNRAVLVFLLIFFLIFSLVKQMIQTQRFARFVQRELIYKQVDKNKIAIKFTNFEISIFPLGTAIKNGHVHFIEENINGTFDSIFFRVNFFDLFKNRPTISQISVDGWKLNILSKKTKKSSSSASASFETQSIKNIVGIITTLPFKITKILLKDSLIQSERLNGKFKAIEVVFDEKTKKIDLDVDGENFQVKINKKWQKNIDNIKALATIEKHGIRVDHLGLKFGKNQILTEGVFSFKKNSYKGKIKSDLSLKELQEKFPTKKLDFIRNGQLHLNGNIKFQKTLNFDGNVHIKNFDSKYASFKEMTGIVDVSRDILHLRTIKIMTNHGSVLVEQEVTIDFKDKKHNLNDIFVKVNNVKTGTIFAFLGEKLKPFDSFITGDVLFRFQKDILSFSLPNGLELKRPNLTFNDFNVLSFEELTLGKTLFQYNLKTKTFSLDSDVFLEESALKAQGYINKTSVDIGFKKGSVNFKKIGTIAGVKTQGQGLVDFRVLGPLDNANITLKGHLHNLSIDEYPLNDAHIGLTYGLETKTLNIDKFQTTSIGTVVSAKGGFNFSQKVKNNMNLEIDVNKISYPSMYKIIQRHLPKFIPKIDGLNFISSGKAVIKTHFKKGIEIVKTDFKFESITYFDELIPSASFELLIDDNWVSLKNFHLKKGRGKVFGHLNYEKNKKYFAYDFQTKALDLNSFSFYRSLPMGLTGKIESHFYSSGSSEDFSTNASIKLLDPTINGKKIPIPIVTIQGDQKGHYFAWNLFEKGIEGNAFLNFKKNGKPSFVNLNINLKDFKQALSTLFRHNSRNDIQGNLRAKLNASFIPHELSKITMDFYLEQLHLNYGKKQFLLSKNKNRINILEGMIKHWNLQFEGDENRITSVGRGNFNNKFTITNNYIFDSELLKLFFRGLNNVSGIIKGKSFISDGKDQNRFISEVSGKNISFSYTKPIGTFENVDFDIAFNNQHIVIKDIQGRYGRGEFDIKGDIELIFPYPRPHIQGNFKNINYNFFTKSNVITSGRINLLGNAPPYFLQGRIIIDKALFADKITDLTKGIGNADINSKFLPQMKKRMTNTLFHFDLDLNGNNSTEIQTNIINAILSSNISIKGPLDGPLFTGNASILPNVSKISFKGQEFLLNEGKIEFRDFNNKESPFLQLEGSSNIDKYKVFLSVIGSTDNLEIKLSSAPSLPREDILSLMAFGYTSDISNNLDEEHKQFLTTMSLGSLLIDQLQIGKDISGTFGLRFSVAPELDDTQENLIENQSAGVSGTRKLKSLTKLTLESNVGKRTNVSVSSSIGAENRQSQEFKVDYNINKILSLQGIYENTTREDRGQDSNSFGGDLKFQWIFGD